MAERIEAIDSDNSKISEDAENEIIDLMVKLSNPKEKMSKYQSIKYLNKHGVKMCKSTFENYVRDGKLPPSRHEAGFKENFWYVCDLDKLIDQKKNGR